MTIGELLAYKSRRNLIIGFVAWLAFAVAMFVAPWLLKTLVTNCPFCGVNFNERF